MDPQEGQALTIMLSDGFLRLASDVRKQSGT